MFNGALDALIIFALPFAIVAIIITAVVHKDPTVGSDEWCKGMSFSRYMDHTVEAQKCPGWEKR